MKMGPLAIVVDPHSSGIRPICLMVFDKLMWSCLPQALGPPLCQLSSGVPSGWRKFPMVNSFSQVAGRCRRRSNDGYICCPSNRLQRLVKSPTSGTSLQVRLVIVFTACIMRRSSVGCSLVFVQEPGASVIPILEAHMFQSDSTMATILLEAVTSWESSVNKLHSLVKQYDESTSNLVTSLRTQAYRRGIEGNIFGVVESVIERINDKLASLTEMEERLERIRVNLNRCRNTSKKLSPISRIPPEILSYIVTLGQEEDDELARKDKQFLDTVWHPIPTTTLPGVNNVPEGVDPEDLEYKLYSYRLSRPRHFPTLFSHVCHDWRNVALSTATFWRKICTFSGMERAKEYLSRSKECPLEIITQVYLGAYGMPSSWQTSSEFMAIQENASRVMSLDMSAHRPGDVVLTLDELAKASPLPPMRHLKLHMMVFQSLTCLTPSSPDLQYEDLLAGIQSLDLRNFFFPWHSVAYAGLKELRLSGVSASAHDTFAVLTASPLLENLILEDSLMSDPAAGFPGSILLRKLRTLELSSAVINSDQDLSFDGLLSMLHAPNIANLSMAQVDNCGSALDSFIKRSSSSDPLLGTEVQDSKLQVLNLRFIQDIDDAMLMRLFSSTPNLIDLTMCRLAGLTDSALLSLSVCDDGCVGLRLLPKLKALRITFCNGITSPEIVKCVIQSRLDAYENSENGVKIERLVLAQSAINRTDVGELRSWLFQNVRYVLYTQDPPLPHFGNEVEEEGNEQ
ncbi:hypothetical protein FRC03_000952 [Tulasnella sp. 419]|nr:hypothetical protein FRC03_000952 [Tulasnella sp. 419]